MLIILLATGKEVIGRYLQVQVVPTKVSQKQKWLKGCIIDFDVSTGQHKVCHPAGLRM